MRYKKLLFVILCVLVSISFVTADWVRVSNFSTGSSVNNIYLCNATQCPTSNTTYVYNYTSFDGNNYTSSIGFNNTGQVFQLNLARFGMINLSALLDLSSITGSGDGNNYTTGIGYTNTSSNITLILSILGRSNISTTFPSTIGPTGPKGDTGNTGASGANGTNGVNGTNGYSVNVTMTQNSGNLTFLFWWNGTGINFYNFTTANLTGPSGTGSLDGNNYTTAIGFNNTGGVYQLNTAIFGRSNLSASFDVSAFNGTARIDAINSSLITQTSRVDAVNSSLQTTILRTDSLNSTKLQNNSNAIFTTIKITSVPVACSVADTFMTFWNGSNSVCTAISSAYVSQTYGNATYGLLSVLNSLISNVSSIGNWSADKPSYVSQTYGNATYIKITDYNAGQTAQNTTINTKVSNNSNVNFTNIYTSNSGRITSNASCSYLLYDSSGVLRDAVC